MQYVFSSRITMTFVRKADIFHCTTMTFNGIEHSFTLDGIGAGIIIHFTMDQQDRCFDLVGMAEGTHGIIEFRCLPVSAVLVLKSKWCKRTVIGTAACQSGFKKIGMRQQVGSHECTVTVSAYSNPVAVTHTQVSQFINGCFRVHF